MSILNTFVRVLANALSLAILARILLSWIPLNRENQVVRIIYEITDPILEPIRRVVPSLGALDLSPMIALILIQVVERILLTLLQGLA